MRSLVKSRYTTIFLRVIFWAAITALILLIFYLNHEGGWREVFRFYRFFYDLKQLRLFIESFGPYAAVMFIILQAFQVIFAPIPGEFTGAVGGFLFGIVWGIILSTIGLTIGSLLAFALTRRFGLRLVEKVVKVEYIERFNDFITHKGLNIVFILFLMPGFPKDSLCFLLGLTHIRIADFIFMNLFGRLPGTLMLTLQGNALKNGRYGQFFWLLAISIILIGALYFTRNYLVNLIGKVVSMLIIRKDNDKKGQ